MRATRSGPRELRFEHALFVLASVMSTPASGRAICDAGLKAFSFDSGVPLVHAREGIGYAKASDEHGVLEVDPRGRAAASGRADLADSRPLRPDGQPVRLDRRHPRCDASNAYGAWPRVARLVEDMIRPALSLIVPAYNEADVPCRRCSQASTSHGIAMHVARMPWRSSSRTTRRPTARRKSRGVTVAGLST